MKRSTALGVWSAGGLVAASMIGSGVFTTTGYSLASLGDPGLVLALWAVGGAIALAGSLSYGALVRQLPESGGEYLFLRRMIHPLAGFLAGWVSLLAGFTAPIAASALAMGEYVTPGWDARWVASTAIVVAVVVHSLPGARGMLLQNGVLLIKLVLIATLVGLGASVEAPAEVVLSQDWQVGDLGVALLFIWYAYSGWNAAVYAASEMPDAGRRMGRVLVLACAVVTLLYLGLNGVFLFRTPLDQIVGQPDVAAIAARYLGGEALQLAVRAAIGLALFSSVLAMVFTGPRVYGRMAQDGLFPRSLVGTVPGPRGVVMQGLFALVLVWWAELADLFQYVGFALGLSTAAAVIALLRLRRDRGGASVPIPGYPWVPLFFVVATLGAAALATWREPLECAIGLGSLLLGVPVWWILERRGGAGGAPGSGSEIS